MLMSKLGATVPHPPFLSVPVWDISDEEIREWQKTRGLVLSGYVAERIRNGAYDNGKELYPYPTSEVYKAVRKETIDEAMRVLEERGMVRQEKGRWYVVAPGRMVPSIRRAVATLLGCRADLPPALAAELDSWKLTLDAINAPAGTPEVPCGASADQAAVVRAIRPARPVRAVSGG